MRKRGASTACTESGRQPGCAAWAMVVVLALLGMLFVVIVILHLTGVVGLADIDDKPTLKETAPCATNAMPTRCNT